MDLLAVSAGLEAVGGFLVLAIGYGACFALWHFVFSARNRHDDDRDRPRSEQFTDTELGTPRGREPTPRGALLLLEQRSSVGLEASFEITTLHLPRYRGQISGLQRSR